MPKPQVITLYKKIRKPHSAGGNLLIYIPKDEATIFHLKPGMQIKITIEILEQTEEEK